MSLHTLGTLTLGNYDGANKNAAFALPVSLCTQSIAVLAKKGAGKSYLAAVISEELHAAGIPPIIIDPTGAHWGLKAGADSHTEGLPFVVFGGSHADLPLSEDAGEMIATAITENLFPAILDLSLFRKGQVNRFLTAFFETLYLKNREVIHLVCDEADAYAPQKPFAEQARTLGAMEDIVRRGRIRGIGVTLITQRPQVLNKDVLTQCDILVAMRLIHPKDIGAIREWIAVHGDPDKAKKLIASLPSLPTGTAWFWAPEFGDLFERVKIRTRRTFDSSATPKPGQSRKMPTKLAAVDLAKLGEAIQEATRQIQENDPAALRAEIARLRKAAGAAAAVPVVRIETKIERVPVLDQAEREKLTAILSTIGRMETELQATTREFGQLSERINAATAPQPANGRSLLESGRYVPTPAGSMVPREAVQTGTRDPALGKGEHVILSACIQYPAGVTRQQLTVLCGYKKSSRDLFIQKLRARGYVQGFDSITATSAGIGAAGTIERLPAGNELRAYWLKKLPMGERRVLAVICEDYPAPIERDAISERTGYKKSSRDLFLQKLTSRGIVMPHNRGLVRAADQLFGNP